MPSDQQITDGHTFERLRTARRLAGFTQEEAAKELGVTGRTYARWERGESAGFFRELQKIAETFNTSVDQLVPAPYPDDEDDRLIRLEQHIEALVLEVRALRDLLVNPALLEKKANQLIDQS